MNRKPLSYILPLCFPVALVACRNEPIDPSTTSEQAADRPADIVRTGALAMKGNKGATGAVTDAGDGIGRMVRVFHTSSPAPSVDQPSPPPGAYPTDGRPPQVMLGSRDRSWGKLTVDSLETVAAMLAGKSDERAAVAPRSDVVLTRATAANDISDDLDRAADSLRKLIRNRLLADTNLESKTDDEAIYLLKPDPTCRSLSAGEALDQDCADTLKKLQIRLRVTRAGDGVEIGLLLSAERVHAASFFVYSNQLALDVYLGGVKQAIIAVAKDLGEKAPALPGVMTGTIEVSLTKDGPRKATLAWSVLEALEFVNADPKVTIRTAATKPAMALTADGDAGTITAKVNIGKTEIVVPWQPGSRDTGADADIVIGGLTGETTFTEASKTIVLKKLGLGAGQSYLDVRGQRVLAADLNPSDGRAFDLSIAFDAQGNPRIAIDPRLDFSLACKLDLVASDFDEMPPAFLLDETYRLQVAPAAGMGPVLAPFEPTAPGDDGGIRVVSGVFSLASSKVTTPVTAAAGQCLVGTTPAANAHPVLGALKVVTCD